MEIEYKWDMPDKSTLDALLMAPELAQEPTGCDEIRMHAIYYDTAQGDMQRLHGGLRVRREGERSVCCLKLAAGGDGGCKMRQEFEVAARDVVDGLRALPDVGAPADICALLIANEPRPSCETDFVRLKRMVSSGGFVAELAVDTGEMRRESQVAPIREVELEFLDGDEGAFHAYAQELQERYDLAPQPLSKLARAMALGD